jgi:hypothetical protein
VVDQLPAETFLSARDRVAANLLEAGCLLVPRRLILPQLGEGLVQIGWAVVADQFPRQALALSDDEITRRIPHGALVLPLDEIVRQMPPELFVVSAPTVDVSGIEDFPPPFQPHVPPPSARTDGPALDTPVEEMSPRAVTAGPGGGPALLTVVAPGLREDAVADTAVRLLPFLRDVRLAGPVAQATLRGAEATVVLTPLTAAAVTGPVLVTAVASGAPLALLERLALRAAGEARVAGRDRAGSGSHGDPDPPSEPGPGGDLHDAPVPVGVRALAGSLQAFGRLTPTVLGDRAGRLVVYLFLAPGLPALAVGRFCRDLHGALEAAEIGSVSSVVLRLPAHRVVLRTVETTVSCTTLLVVAGGPVDRPGLAHLQVDRAALRLRGAARG